MYKLLYCIRIVSSTYMGEEEEEGPSWKDDFIALGGFEHLLNTLIVMEVPTIDNMLTLQCI